MNCPLCKTSVLASAELADGLSGLTCETCGGTWVARDRYDAWRAKLPGALPETALAVSLSEDEAQAANVCPQCGHLLLPYRVGHGLSFSIDYCGACGGVWFGKDEWASIKAKNLHDNLHDIVSAHWQAEVRKESVQEALEKVHRRNLGESYAKAHELREWLRQQPKRSHILAYLSDAGPGA